ncbi:MAG TPA: J domain-containing protein [Holophagaceae bacterium]|nr:J domain-containing protein [Holophagaceae bacterium]
MRTRVSLTFRDWQPRLFLRLGPLSLLADVQAGVLEANGRPVRWFARTSGPQDPLEGLGTPTPLEAPEDPRLSAMGAVLERFVRERPASALDLSFKLLGVLGGLWALLIAAGSPSGVPWWAWGAAGETRFWAFVVIYAAIGLLLQALGARVRGVSSIAYGVLWCLGCAAIGHPWYGLVVFPLVVAAGCSRFLNPWLGPLGVALFLGFGEGPPRLLVLPWAAMAAILTVMELLRVRRPLRLAIEPGFTELVRGAEALSRTRLWSQSSEERPLTDAFVLRADGIALPGGQPLWFIENGAESLLFLPGALLWMREGIRARLIPWSEVHLQGQPCAWRNAPGTLDLGPEQWLITLWIPGARPWTLIAGEATWGRRCTQAWGRVMPEPAAIPEPPIPPPARRAEDLGLFEAYQVLGLPHGAPAEEVRKAFRQLARTHHPDAHPDASPEEVAELELRMQAINEAYARLRDEGAA